MSNKPTHAFPFKGEHYVTPGMELRDWFAGQALAGWLAEGISSPEEAAESAYAYANAMMVERKHNKGD